MNHQGTSTLKTWLKMYPYEKVREVHLELADRCNAACPQCPRSDHGGPVNPNLLLTELNLHDIRKIFPPSFVAQLRRLYACGNYGDPIVAPDCLDIFQYFRACNPDIKLGIHTNGGARSVDFWQALGRVLPKGKGYVRFGIDGLEDTNHVYRRGVRWRVLIRNIKAFIKAGGNAEWDYLIFRHNEHQIDEARRLASVLGFTMFNLKKSGRFLDWKNMEYKDSTPVKDRSGHIVGRMERPVNPAYQNSALKGLKDLQHRYGNMDNYLDQAEVQCKVQASGSIYVSAEGYVLPCCWLAAQLRHEAVRARAEIFDRLEALGGVSHVDGRRRSIREIVEDRFFQRVVPESWSKSSCAEGKLRTCARVCGRDFKRYEAQSPLNRGADVAVETRHS